jgi:hypothetical protein
MKSAVQVAQPHVTSFKNITLEQYATLLDEAQSEATVVGDEGYTLSPKRATRSMHYKLRAPK